MGSFLSSLRDICLFRRGPEDMPYAPRLLVALLIACAAVQAAFDWHNGSGFGVIVAACCAGLAVVAVLFLLLRGRGKAERFTQTLTALAAVKLLFDVVVYPLALLLPLKQLMAHPTDPGVLSSQQTAVMVLVAGLGVWELCVWISTLRRSLEIPLAGAVLVFLLLFFVHAIVLGLGAGVAGAS